MKAAYELLNEGLKSAQDVSSSSSAAFKASTVGGGDGGRNAVDLAVAAALSSAVTSSFGDASLNSRAAELGKQRAAANKKEESKNGANAEKTYSEFDA